MKTFLAAIQKLVLSIIRKFQHVRSDKVSPVILTYTLYGTADKVKVFGRIVEEIKKHDFVKSRSRLMHFVQVIKLFITIKYSKSNVLVTYKNKFIDLKSDDEGFFYGVIEEKDHESIPAVNKVLTEDSVYFKILSLDHKTIDSNNQMDFSSRVLKPNLKTKKIIVSDIDDTVMKSKATNFTKMALKTLFSTASHRKTFPEAADVYNRMRVGESGEEENLFFYISSSTWNIYPLLEGFLKINRFPDGVMLLQDVVSEKLKGHTNSHGHKLDRISELMDFYVNLNLILIGDAGQQDAEIYLQIAKNYPGRVDKILIRKTWWSDVIIDQKSFLERAESLGVEMHYFEKLTEINYF